MTNTNTATETTKQGLQYTTEKPITDAERYAGTKDTRRRDRQAPADFGLFDLAARGQADLADAMAYRNVAEDLTDTVTIDKGRPEPGKQYRLTAGKGAPCIMNGNTWAESEVTEREK